MNIILGSQSVGRRQVMESLGIPFTVMNPDIDEKAIRDPDPHILTRKLAHAKAEALMPQISKPSLLITSDQVVVVNGEILEKPESDDEARRYFALYARYPAENITSILVTNTQTGKTCEASHSSKVYFKPFPENVQEQLIRERNIFRAAGGYIVDDPLIAPLVKRIEGDVSSVLGLPADLTLSLLEQMGYTTKTI